ncbi:hypothetical protein LEL_10767 [Akanthomyces lecanii RCEF 1005]|uniref:Uncharacterized protein n=1 Tax=Akanthomyces lecanii RCEF 1005 TaxID=1081108 RepID=A0A167TS40_CORDF|nr:hypothetical protein LEL_10767 [Akanthomyces lecanii RCEF 1005]
MHRRLLPSSTATGAPRLASVAVVLGHSPQLWLQNILKSIRGAHHMNPRATPLQSAQNCQRFLTYILDQGSAIWILGELHYGRWTIPIHARIVCVDLVDRNEATFKLTRGTTDALIQYHEQLHCAGSETNAADWHGKAQQIKKQHENFVRDIEKFVFCTHVSVLVHVQKNGAGRLPDNRQLLVESELAKLMKPLHPPLSSRCIDIPLQPRLSTETNYYPAGNHTGVNLMPTRLPTLLPSTALGNSSMPSSPWLPCNPVVPLPSELIHTPLLMPQWPIDGGATVGATWSSCDASVMSPESVYYYME